MSASKAFLHNSTAPRDKAPLQTGLYQVIEAVNFHSKNPLPKEELIDMFLDHFVNERNNRLTVRDE